MARLHKPKIWTVNQNGITSLDGRLEYTVSLDEKTPGFGTSFESSMTEFAKSPIFIRKSFGQELNHLEIIPLSLTNQFID